MIKVTLSNEILKYITEIDKNRYKASEVSLPIAVASKLRKNSKKKSSYASTKIEGNPLSEKQVDEVIDSDERKHYLKPEQEVRNYFLALNYLEEKAAKKERFSKKLILDVQKYVEKGASKEKIGLRGPMPLEYYLRYMIHKQGILIIFLQNILIYRICWMNWWNM